MVGGAESNGPSGDRAILYLDRGGGYTEATCKKTALDHTHTHTHLTSACISDGV